jgi:hypothetical protein
VTRQGLDAVELDEETVADLQSAVASVDQAAVVVRPHQDNSGIAGMDEVLRSLPRGETDTTGVLRRREQDTAAPFTFEARYAPDPLSPGTSGSPERVVSLQYVGGDERTSDLLGRQLPDKYPDSRTERRPATWLDPDEGQHMAVATLGLRRYTLYPLKNVALDEFRRDPTGSILTEMVGAAEAGGIDADVAVQVMARPTATDWKQGVPDGFGVAEEYGDGLTAEEDAVTAPLSTKKLRWVLTQPTHERRAILPTPIGTALGWAHHAFRDEFEHPPSTADTQAAKMLSDLDGRAWAFHVRIVAVSDDPALAQERVASTAEMFDNFYEYRGAQTFVPIPQTGRDAVATARAAAGREWPDDREREQRMIKPQIEVAGLLNIPEAEHVSTNKMKWALASPGEGVPPGTPRVEWDRLDSDPAEATKEEIQVGILDAGPEAVGEDVKYYGLGARHGVEAGINYDAVTNPHKFVHGESGTGKTTFLAGDASQQFRAPSGGGGLRLDPTGDDTDAVLAEWPEDRPPEDLIYMDLTRERIPRFNFLEIPEYLDPDEDARQFDEFVEKLAEDILAMVGQAGGTDNYVGGLMKRVVKTVVRAMGRIGEDATLFDVAAVCSDAETLAAFGEAMPDDRLRYLRDRVRTLAEREDSELDPLAGRLDEWVLNPNVRELICARNPTFSVHDAVSDGKEIVVRFSESGSETVKHMVGNALITRTYFAQRFHRPDAPFELVVDEAQSVITAASDIENIMDQGRKFGYRVTVACQRPATQLPDGVRAAILGNARTTISFASGRREEALAVAGQHDGVEAEDLVHISPFTFYMSTETVARESTHSYQVEAFRAPREARVMAAEARGEDPEATTEAIGDHVADLKAASLDRYAVTREEVDDTSLYTDADADADAETERSLTITGGVERAAVAGVYDTTLRARAPEESVALTECVDAVRRRVARLAETPADTPDRLASDGDVWRRVLQHIDDSLLEVSGTDGETTLRARSPRATLATVGENQSAGGADHTRLLWDAYGPLTRAGIDIRISQASGADPDAVATAAPPAEQATPELVQRLLGDQGEARIEAECTTGRTKPGATARHCLQAAEEGRAHLALVRPDDAPAVADTLLRDPPLCRSDHDVDGETRFYTSPRDLRLGGEAMTRPGTSENVWIREESSDVVLRDASGTEYARFDTVEAVFSDPEPYPLDGETTIKRPVITEHFDDGVPSVSVVTVPEGAVEPADLEIAGLSAALADLDVPDGALDLLDALQQREEPATKAAAHAITEEQGVGVSRRTVGTWLNALTEEGAVVEAGTTDTGATRYAIETEE